MGSVAAVSTGLLALGLGWNTGPGAFSGGIRAAGAAAAASLGAPAMAVFRGATVTGAVKLVGKPAPNPAIDMSGEPTCKAKYQTAPLDEIVAVNANGTLANVFVYVTSGLPAGVNYPAPTTPVVLDQSGCLYKPRVFGIMVSQPLEIENSDSLLHNVKTLGKKNRRFNISQPGVTLTRSVGDQAGLLTGVAFAFTAPEVMVPFECSMHGWMRAYAGVLSHPFFAVTGTDGSFSIKGLPPGTYTIEAWHEKYGTQTATVTVKDNETTSADFTYTAQ
jgi:hypothetical protein